ncbi:DUF2298 domain-containing protein [Methyloglobulus sp.]|uniref:DUF2298 domain-containing protein n=1 Tax=Methyloglobulus sp. TaxID=2518622 RepID=UPI0032B8549A
MYLIYLFLTIALILVNLAGLTAWVSRYLPAQASARVLGLFVLTLAIFAFEHLHGLGKLNWIWPLSTGLALWCLSTRQDRPFWTGELVFMLGFAYGCAWRFAFPNIDAGSEHLTDLYFISNFMGGQTLPAPDRWLAGSFFDCYYAFQHYGAALLARLFNLEAGLAMNLAWAVLIALLASLAWEISSYFVSRFSLKMLLLVALISGGNGLSPLMPFMIKDNATDTAGIENNAITHVWASTRFYGMYDEHVNTPLGLAIAGDPQKPDFADHPDLPLETIGYFSTLGDYHPPLGGFIIALWTLALSAFLGIRKVTDTTQGSEAELPNGRQADALAFFALGLTPALVLVTNAWVFPLQCLLLSSWLLFRQWKADINWPALIIGGVAGFGLIYPFLSYFAPNSLATPIRWVAEGYHTPSRLLLAMHWPVLLWLGVGLVVARHSPWAGWLTLTLAMILGLSELIFVDDPMSGKYERFNTLLKWWSWLWPTALIGLGSVCIGLGGRVVKTLMVLSLSALLMYTIDLGRYWHYVSKPQLGQMTGNGWLKQDATLKELLVYLKNAPEGLVLESIEQGAYSSSTALSLFANKPLVLGWPDHLAQWRGNPEYIVNRATEIRAFYKGGLTDPLSFLGKFPVQTIIWTLADEQRMPDVRQKLQSQISRDYHWRAFYQNGSEAVGIWERRLLDSNQKARG